MTIEQYFRNLASAAFVPLIFWAVLAVSMHQDRSRYRNTIYLMLAMVSSLPFAAALFGPAEQTAAGVISAGILILLLAVPYMLIANGVTMIRKEGRRLADLLSLLMGILVGTGELSFFLFILLPYLSSGASGTAGNISKVQMSLYHSCFIRASWAFFRSGRTSIAASSWAADFSRAERYRSFWQEDWIKPLNCIARIRRRRS